MCYNELIQEHKEWGGLKCALSNCGLSICEEVSLLGSKCTNGGGCSTAGKGGEWRALCICKYINLETTMFAVVSVVLDSHSRLDLGRLLF